MRDAGATTATRVLAVMLAAGICVHPGLPRAQGVRGGGPSAAAAEVPALEDDRTEKGGLSGETLLPAIWEALRAGPGPVRWGGSTGIDLRTQHSEGNAARRQHLEFLNLNAATYLFQPWFAQINGGIGLTASTENPGGTQSAGVTGNGSLQVFPFSRFPFHGYFDVNDSRTSGELTNSDFTNKRFGIRQTYRPAQGAATYVGGYDHSTLSSSTFGDDTVSSLTGQYTNTIDAHGIDVSGNHTRNTRAFGEGSALDRYTVRHSWRPDAALQVENLASFNRSDFRLLSAGVIPDNRSEVMQLSSFGTWRPETEKPLTVTGGLRYFRAESANANTVTDSQSFNGNVAVNYSITPYTRTFASATATQADVGARSVLITSQSVGASHAPETRMIGRYRYGWNTGGSLFNQTGGDEGDRQNANVQIGHNLIRTDTLSSTASRTTNYSQSYAAVLDSGNASSQTLNHSASVTWRRSPTSSSNMFVSGSVSDSRTTGNNESEFQMLNLQMSGQLQFSRRAYGSANLTLQIFRQDNANTPDQGFRNAVSGTVSYQHSRAFGVPQLRYSLLGQVNTLQGETRLTGDVNALRDQVTFSVEQRLDYNIGRLEMRLSGRIAEINNRRSAQLFLRIARRFGTF